MYRPPNYDQNHDLNFLFFDQFRKLASAQADQILICGDFNYGKIDWKLHSVSAGPDSDAQRFYDLIKIVFCTSMLKKQQENKDKANPQPWT